MPPDILPCLDDYNFRLNFLALAVVVLVTYLAANWDN